MDKKNTHRIDNSAAEALEGRLIYRSWRVVEDPPVRARIPQGNPSEGSPGESPQGISPEDPPERSPGGIVRGLCGGCFGVVCLEGPGGAGGELCY